MVSEKHGDDTWYTVVKGTGVIPGTQDDLNNAITDSTNKDITVVMPADQTLTLDNGIANEGDRSGWRGQLRRHRLRRAGLSAPSRAS